MQCGFLDLILEQKKKDMNWKTGEIILKLEI